jgi:hypothetical protein
MKVSMRVAVILLVLCLTVSAMAQMQTLKQNQATIQPQDQPRATMVDPKIEKLCNNYAHASVRQQKWNQEYGCNYSGDYWHSGFKAHYDWCMRGNHQKASRLVRERDSDIAVCKKKKAAAGSPGGDQRFCTDFANNCLTQNARNKNLNCKLTGGFWQSDFKQIYNWCMKKGASAARKVFLLRVDSLKACQVKADDPCSSRAKNAVSQYKINRDLGCGFSGDQWHSDLLAHFRRCKKIGAREEMRNYKKRLNELNACRARKEAGKKKPSGQGGGQTQYGKITQAGGVPTPVQQICTDYANTAIKQDQENNHNRCGFGWPDWHSNFKTHYKWCMSNTKESYKKTKMRNKKLTVCKANLAADRKKVGWCTDYADKAVAQYRRNRELKCGYEGLGVVDWKWHGNKKKHFNWCLGTYDSTPDQETAWREKQLKKCEAQKTASKIMHEHKKKYCPDYAQRAVTQDQENQRRKCGFWGFAWHSDFNRHKDWCMKARDGEPPQEEQNREAKLVECRRKRP